MFLQFDPPGFDLTALIYLTNAATALPIVSMLELHRRFTNAHLYPMFGFMEAVRALYNIARMGQAKTRIGQNCGSRRRSLGVRYRETPFGS